MLRRLDDAGARDAAAARRGRTRARTLPLTDEARAALRAMADGDGRFLLNLVEELFALPADAEPLDPAGLARGSCSSARRSTTRRRRGTTT